MYIDNFYNNNFDKCEKNSQKKLLFFLSTYIFLCGFVFIEPSPAEYFFLLFVPFLIFQMKFALNTALFYVLYITTILLSMVNGYKFGWINYRFVLIDIYLISLFFVIASVKFKKVSLRKALKCIMIFWTLSAFTNFFLYFLLALIGRSMIFGTQILAFGIRMQGMFKDPNVMGPFMIVPAVYWMDQFLISSKKRILYFMLVTLLSLGVVLSFSRAAWLNYLVVILLMLMSSLKETKKFITLVIVSIFLIAFILIIMQSDYMILGIKLGKFFSSRIGIQSYDIKRFEAQKDFLKMFMQNPLFGIGPGNYEEVANYSAHNTYARLLGERGIIGFLMFSILLLFSIIKLWTKKKLLAFIIIGLIFNSFFIDTLHWRHLWFLIAFSFITFEQKF